MNIGLFGGTFDPVHRGHVALARVAMERCNLHRIYFVPAHIPPHKQKQPLTPFAHRFAMLVLATASEKAFVPSLLEAPAEGAGTRKNPEKPNYTIDTIRRLKTSLKGRDNLFLLIGIDAFADITKWHGRCSSWTHHRQHRPGKRKNDGRNGDGSASCRAGNAGINAPVLEGILALWGARCCAGFRR